MKRLVGIAVIAVIVGSVPQVYGGMAEFSGQAGIKIADSYVWRGREINDAPVVQPELPLFMDRFGLNIWGTWDVEYEKNATSARTRLDVTLDYTIEWEKVQLKTGVIGYIYHDQPDTDALDTYEAYVDIVVDVLLYPSLTVYYDFERVEGIYAVLGAGYSRELNGRVDIETKVSMGMGTPSFNSAWFPVAPDSTIDTDRSALVDLRLELSVPASFDKGITVTPSVSYVTLLDSELEQAVEEAGLSDSSTSVSLAASWDF